MRGAGFDLGLGRCSLGAGDHLLRIGWVRACCRDREFGSEVVNRLSRCGEVLLRCADQRVYSLGHRVGRLVEGAD